MSHKMLRPLVGEIIQGDHHNEAGGFAPLDVWEINCKSTLIMYLIVIRDKQILKSTYDGFKDAITSNNLSTGCERSNKQLAYKQCGGLIK